MFDPKKLLNDLLGSQVPGTGGSVRDGAGKAVQMAKDNPLAAGALVAVLLGTKSGRSVTGSARSIASRIYWMLSFARSCSAGGWADGAALMGRIVATDGM